MATLNGRRWITLILIAETPKKPEVYYDAGHKDYLIKNNDGDWLAVNETSIRRHLTRAGFFSKRLEGEPQSKLDECLTDIQLENSVAFAGPLAGYPQGLTSVCKHRILVTTSPKLIEPMQGDDTILQELMLNILGEEQRTYLYGWLKIAYEALCYLRAAVALASARNICRAAGFRKSLLQSIITEILGGRVAKPYRYMSGGTDFNGDLFGAEHLAIEDEIASTDIRMRRAFGARIYEFTVISVQSCHHKNRTAISLTPFWRVSVSVNDEPENLQILPPFDESIIDKVMLFRLSRQPMPMPTNTDEERNAFMSALVAALPAFLYNLTQWKIPEELKSQRFGITHFHHPELLGTLAELSPEMKLLSLIDGYLQLKPADNYGTPREFYDTAEELERILNDLYSHEVRRLLTWPHACGTYLGRLEKLFPKRFVKCRSANERKWKITLPVAPGK